MDGGAWWATVHGVAKSQTQLSDFTFTLPFHALEKEMAKIMKGPQSQEMYRIQKNIKYQWLGLPWWCSG